MKTCPVCGNEVQDGYRFCTHCGTELAKKEEEAVQPEQVVEEEPSTKKEAVCPAPRVEEGKASSDSFWVIKASPERLMVEFEKEAILPPLLGFK